MGKPGITIIRSRLSHLLIMSVPDEGYSRLFNLLIMSVPNDGYSRLSNLLK
jgi:hypothetical protein